MPSMPWMPGIAHLALTTKLSVQIMALAIGEPFNKLHNHHSQTQWAYMIFTCHNACQICGI